MRFLVNYTKEDLFRLQEFHFSNTFFKWFFRIFGYTRILTSSFYFFIWFPNIHQLFGIVVGIIFSNTKILAMISSAYTASTSPIYNKNTKHLIEINTDKVTHSIEKLVKLEREWPIFRHYYLDNKIGLVLFQDPRSLVYIPKREINQKQFLELEKLLKKNVQEKDLFSPTLKAFILLPVIIIFILEMITFVPIFYEFLVFLSWGL